MDGKYDVANSQAEAELLALLRSGDPEVRRAAVTAFASRGLDNQAVLDGLC